MSPMAYANLVWVLLIVQWISSSPTYALEEEPTLPETNFWNSYDEAVSRFGGVGSSPLRSEFVTRLQEEHYSDGSTGKFNGEPSESQSEIFKENFQPSSGKITELKGDENSFRRGEKFSVNDSSTEVIGNQIVEENNVVDEESLPVLNTDLSGVEASVTASSRDPSFTETGSPPNSNLSSYEIENVARDVGSMSSFGTTSTTLDIETKVTEFFTERINAIEGTAHGGGLSYNQVTAGAGESDVNLQDKSRLKNSFLSNPNSAANGMGNSEDMAISMTYMQHSRNDEISSGTKAQSGDSLDQSGELLNAIISTVLSLRDHHSQEDLVDPQSNFIPYKYAQNSTLSGRRPDANHLNGGFSRIKSGPLKTSLIQLYKESFSEGRLNVSNQDKTLPMKFNGFFLGERTNSTENNAQSITLGPTFMRDSINDIDTSFNSNTNLNTSHHNNYSGFNVSLTSNTIGAFNNSRTLNSTTETRTNTSLTTLPPVRSAPTPVKRVVIPVAATAVGSVVVNHPLPAPEEPNIRHDESTSQFDSLVRVVQRPSLLTAGLLNAINTVGLFGGIISLPFLLPLAVGKKRKRSLEDEQYAVMDRKFMTDSR